LNPTQYWLNFNKLKPYKYVDQTLKGIQSSKYRTSLKSIDSNHRKEKSDEHSKDHRTIKIIDTDQIVASEETSVNLMSQQVMKIFTDYDYTISKSLDYRSDKFITLE
jgi:hypothetical protein